MSGTAMYTERFPDTLFLPDRARLAINCLNGCLNPAHRHLPFCLTDLTGSPPRMAHTQFDWSDHTSRVIDALLLAGAMTGDAAASRNLPALEALFEEGFGDDGLHYTPENPWSFRHANMHYQRSVINALISLALTGQRDGARERGRALVRALDRVSIHRDGYAYFPAVERLPDGWPRGDWEILGWGVDPANTNGRLIFGLTRLAELNDDPVARALAGAYARHVMDASSAYADDGSFATGMEFREGHFHSRAVTMLGVIRHGVGQHDARAVQWGLKVFERALRYGTRFGWFPERLIKSRAHGCETCAIVDMMESAIWLARAGHVQHWETAERFLRNQLVESQLTRIDGLPAGTGAEQGGEWESTRDVAARSLGGFAGWSQPNDFFSKVMHRWDLYTCCSAQGVRGLFNAWTQALQVERGVMRVNLLINNANRQAVVRSWLPHRGRLEIEPRIAAELQIRIPSWVDRHRLSVRVGGQPVAGRFVDAAFLGIGKVEPGTLVEVEFPVVESITDETVLDTTYRVGWRADTVVGIDPGGSRMPLYDRAALRSEQVGRIERSVPAIDFEL
ncbi:MAG TPA: glycoside hydrolase family 127 protein [Burkholderiaceae bacterium]|nr:glycoside hydrolase family 127 protein [Burkholderiaceae bacterium]